MQPLPIDDVLPSIRAALCAQTAVVVQAPTGAGKTTRVPPALLERASDKVLVLEPRRLAARAAAARMAQERGQSLGDDIGYHVRFDRKARSSTRLLAVTPGILLRYLLDDPYLEKFGAVVFDEFHERGLEADLGLGLVRLVQQTVRPELRIVVMSATLDTDQIARYLGGCPVIASAGRLFPVDIRHQDRPLSQPWPAAIHQAAERLLEETSGDLLVFLPGLAEIRATTRHLQDLAARYDLAVLPLYGDLPADQQDAALLPGPRRKVVLATNVAETSVTVEGVTGVIDTGMARILSFDAGVGLDRLRLTPISRAAADQRAGRAGRTQPGICVRLWSEAGQRTRPAQETPEIQRVDLAGAALHLLCLGETDLARFPWLEPPTPEAVERALLVLRRLGAVADSIGTLAASPTGQQLARLPVHPRLARLLLEAQTLGVLPRAALAAALLSERDPFERAGHRPSAVGRAATLSDALDRVEALEAFEQRGVTAGLCGSLHPAPARAILKARDQFLRLLGQPASDRGGEPGNAEDFCRALLAAFPDRLARRREPGSRRGVMVGGRGVQLAHGSGVTEGELFLCIDVDAGRQESLVRLASLVRREWLPAARMTSGVHVFFDEEKEAVQARKQVRYEDLVLEESAAALPEGDEVARVLARHAALHLDRVLPSEDSAAGRWLIRLRCLAGWLPEANLPPFADEQLKDIVPELCSGRRSFADLRRADWEGALLGRLTFQQSQLLDKEAPERFQVPGGSRLALKYEVGRPPVLAVKIQQLFGLEETPHVARGRVAVLLHLLAPNGRPQQVTDDLASFWKNTYPVVRKELRGRYPKHAWPEDPRRKREGE